MDRVHPSSETSAKAVCYAGGTVAGSLHTGSESPRLGRVLDDDRDGLLGQGFRGAVVAEDTGDTDQQVIEERKRFVGLTAHVFKVGVQGVLTVTQHAEREEE